MKPPVSSDIRLKVLRLRRSLSLRSVAELTGLPIGTVKTICSRSGAFRDNEKHRELFSLPPIRMCKETLPAVLELPPKRKQTGDEEIDAVLWLRDVICTGQAALIQKAMEAAKLIKTPLDELEKRYTKHLVSMNPGHFAAAFGSFGFADLELLAERSIANLARRNEAVARFGDSVFVETAAELFCIEALAGAEVGEFWSIPSAEVDRRFRAIPEFMPNTLSDCLYELGYWRSLSQLRRATDSRFEGVREGDERWSFVTRTLANIRPRSKEESIAAFHYIAKEDLSRDQMDEILLNLIG